MGLMDLAAKVILTYKADVSDAKAKLRELSGEEKKLAQERLAAEEKHNKGIEKQIKGIGLLAAGIGAAMGAVALAKVGLDEYAKTSETAARKVTEIKTAASTAMDSVQASIGKTVVSMEPLISGIAKFVTLLGEAGVAGPLAMTALSLAISGNPVIAALVLGASSGTDPADVIFNAQGYIDGKRAQAKRGADGALAAARTFDPDPVTWKGIGDKIASAIDYGVRRGTGASEWGKIEFGKGGKGVSRYGDNTQSPYTDWTPGPQSATGALAQSRTADGVARDIYGNPTDLSALAAKQLFDLYEERTAQWIERTKANAGQNILDQMFGTNGQINAKQAALDMLTGAATAGFDAMVDGTMSAGAAMKMAVADALKALGSKMLVLGIGETAAGFAAIASGYGFAAAAPHFKSAGIYAAGAALAGLGAHSLGTSGGAGAGGGYSASAPSSSGGGSLSGGTTRDTAIIVYEDQFAEMNGHDRALRAERVVSRVVGTGAVRNR